MLTNSLRKTVDLILPPRCIVTGNIVDRQNAIDAQAWAAINFIADPCCERCGFPFDFPADSESGVSLCAACLKSPPPYDRARASLVYDEASKPMILGFKHGDKTHAVNSFIPWLKIAGTELLTETDFLVPVPLHRWRLLRRRYNQAALLASSLARETKTACLADALLRTRATPMQGHKKARHRRANVRHAFAINPKHRERIEAASILLIDDVFTSGATISECARTLKKAGAASVNALTLARVVRPVQVI